MCPFSHCALFPCMDKRPDRFFSPPTFKYENTNDNLYSNQFKGEKNRNSIKLNNHEKFV